MVNISIYLITAWLTTVTAFCVGILVYLKNTKGHINKRWFLMSLSVTFWSLFLGFMFNSKDAKSGLIYSRILMIGANLIPITFYHFILAFLDREKDIQQKRVLFVGYVATVVLLLVNFNPLFVKSVSYRSLVRCFYPDAGPFFIFHILLYFGLTAYSCILMYKTIKISTGQKRNQIQYVLVASAVGFLGGATTFPFWYQIQILPFGSHFVWLYSLTITVAIIRYHLMDIRVVISRAAIFTLVYAVVLGIPFLIIKLAKPYLVGAFSDRWWLVILAVGMVLAGIGPLIYMKLQRRAEAMLLREERKRHEALRRASQNILRFSRLDALLRAIVHSLIRIMQVKLAAIYLVDEEKNVFTLKSVWQPPIKHPDLPKELTFDSTLIKTLTRQKNYPLHLDEVRFHSQRRNVLEIFQLKQAFESLKVQLIIPAIRSDKLIGFLALGDKRSERGYSHEDIEVLMVLANHATLAIENAIFAEGERERQAILFHSASLASLGTMASMMGHQVNNRFQAVNNLAGFGEVLETILQSKDNLSSGEWKKLVQQAIGSLRRISDEATKGGETVASIRRLGRLSSEEFSPVDLKEVLDIALGVLRYKIKFDEFDFSLHVPDTLPKIMGDATQLGEVFFNLIDNAYDAVKERRETNGGSDYKPQISIKAYLKKDDKHLYVDVSDTGMGIKEDFMPKLFIPFYTTKASSGKGTGLGLHVIKRIIEFHKGRISVNSKYGEGTTFTVELPVEKKEKQNV